MTAYPLAGAFARVDRAAEHLADLRPRIEAMRQAQNQATFPYFETEPPYNLAPDPDHVPAGAPCVVLGET
jgi:hypothetical protein